LRFVVTGEWSRNQLLRLIIVLFLIFILGFCVINALLFFAHMSFSYDGVVAHYLGKPGPFGAAPIPRSYKVLLEVSHGHLFAMAILAMTMTHLLLFIPAPRRLKLLLVLTTFAAALLNEASGWLIRYVSPTFAYLKLAMFTLLELSLLAICLMLVVAIFAKWRNAYRDSDPREAAES
jgi:hypothetical protein